MAPELRRVAKIKLPWPAGDIVGAGLGMAARVSNLITGSGLSIIPKFDTPESFHIIVAGGRLHVKISVGN